MSTRRLLPLHAQKAVVGRALVYRALDLYHVELDSAGYGVLWTGIRSRVLDSTLYQVEFCPTGSLSEYLHQLGAEIRANLSFPDADARGVCEPLLDEIDQVLDEAGRATDDLLTGAFGDAVTAAVELYRCHGLDLPDDLRQRITASFEYQSEPVRSELPVALTATTVLQDLADGPSACVAVRVNAQMLDELTVFSLPYVLLHECVCHVLQGPWQPGRRQPDASSRFAEGWMDVAAFVAHQMLDRLRPPSGSPLDLLVAPRPAAHAEAAERVHAARHAQSSWDRAWSQRAKGARAARAVQALLGRLPEVRHLDPAAVFLMLSVQLNTSSFDNKQRDLFATEVYRATLGRIHPGLVAELRTYVETRDLGRLVKEVTGLFT
ncbi:hypothetical protein [Jidongwangia harbinensis]|uniref:hypothetical protein n=1 Tax=Jidongwangia harbinensis TaxID=2878561 RepID=UPI001CDA28FA|nr:hypothetical protein [Jidongwangia harbinensis]MCA2211315.1 hypothetical protein [Jidongwangia harbinensis]